MKAREGANKPQRASRANRRGTLTGSGLDLETKIFSASGRGRTFFLTSLFIELIEPREGLQISGLPVIRPESAARVSTLTSIHTKSLQPQLERCQLRIAQTVRTADRSCSRNHL